PIMTGLFADWRYGLLLVLLFCLPVLLGDVGTAFIMIMAVLVAIGTAPRLLAPDHSPPFSIWLFLLAFVLMTVALIASAQNLWDTRFILNFVPLLLALPLAVAGINDRPQANLTHIAVLSAGGAALSLIIASVQVFILNE